MRIEVFHLPGIPDPATEAWPFGATAAGAEGGVAADVDGITGAGRPMLRTQGMADPAVDQADQRRLAGRTNEGAEPLGVAGRTRPPREDDRVESSPTDRTGGADRASEEPAERGPVLRHARLTPALLARQIDALIAARQGHLADKPVAEVARSIGRVAERLLDRQDDLRRRAVAGITAVTGQSREMVELTLDRMAADWTESSLLELLRTEFGDPRALDGFIARGGSLVRAYGPGLTVHVLSGNVVGVGVTSLIRSLLVKSATLGKSAVGEPVLPALFARALYDEDPALGSCIAVAYWPGGDEALESTALSRADAVVAYGSADAVEAVRRRTPAGAVFLGYGHRVSFGVLAREAMSASEAEAHAEDAALAVSIFDQQGCVSPHLFFVEEGGEVAPADWAAMLARAMESVERRLPRGTLDPAEAAAIRQARAEAEFAGLAGGGQRVYQAESGTAWTVIYDPEPRFAPSCLNRLVRVQPVPTLDDVPVLVRRIGPVLQTVGYAGPHDRLRPLAEQLGRLGASRIAPLRAMPWPPPAWHHDGRPPLADLVRWCDWEVGAERATP